MNRKMLYNKASPNLSKSCLSFGGAGKMSFGEPCGNHVGLSTYDEGWGPHGKLLYALGWIFGRCLMKFSQKNVELHQLCIKKLVRNANCGTMLYPSESGIRNKLAINLPYKTFSANKQLSCNLLSMISK